MKLELSREQKQLIIWSLQISLTKVDDPRLIAELNNLIAALKDEK